VPVLERDERVDLVDSVKLLVDYLAREVSELALPDS
jgi:hypothetical protein